MTLAVRRALEAAGVVFIDENSGGGPGVILSLMEREQKKLRTVSVPRMIFARLFHSRNLCALKRVFEWRGFNHVNTNQGHGGEGR